MSNTLLFSNIPQWGVRTTGSKTSSDFWPSPNASGWNRNQIIITGRDNQTTNRPGVTPPYPTCPYHMPTNLNRFNDLGLNLPIKKKNDIIQLKDINRLIERVVLMTYIWNAEADDILNYRISSKVRGKLPNTLKLLGTTNNNLSGTNLIAKIKKGNTVQQNIPYLRYTLSESILSGANLTKMQTPTSLLDPTDKVKDISVSEDTYFRLPDLRNVKITDGWVDTGQTKLYDVSAHLNTSNDLVLNYYDDVRDYDKNNTTPIAFSITKIKGTDITPNSFYKIRYRAIDKDARDPKLQYIYLKFWWHRTINNTFNTSPLTNITESDYTIQETYSTKRGKHPIIVSQPWSNIKTQLNRLIDSLNTLAVLVFDGRNDTDTLYRINNFKASNVAMFDGFDPDDPDTNFYNYQAQKGAIIRVGFYNTLVEAYKLMINSCMCNCDCKCNANCLCNTNCGCNYG